MAYTYLHLSENSLAARSGEAGHLMNTLDNHVDEAPHPSPNLNPNPYPNLKAVNKGWYSLFVLIEAYCGIIFIVFVTFQLIWPNPHLLLVPLMVVLILVRVINRCRESQEITLCADRELYETGWFSAASQMLRSHHTYSVFGRRHDAGQRFSKTYSDFYKHHRIHRKYELGTEWLTRCLLGVVFYGVLLATPFLVTPSGLSSEGLLDIATFVGLVKVFGKLSKYVLKWSKSTTAIQRGSIGLCEVMTILNAETQTQQEFKRAMHRHQPGGRSVGAEVMAGAEVQQGSWSPGGHLGRTQGSGVMTLT